MKKYLLLFLVFLASIATYAQCNYIDAMYAVQTNLNVPYESVEGLNPLTGARFGTQLDVKMDIFRPVNLPGEGIVKRPVVILCHGMGTRKDNVTVASLAVSLAQRGYVAVCIDYRADLFAPGEINLAPCSTEVCKAALTNRVLYANSMDVHKAINFLVGQQATYQIDPTKFILGGHSLGGGTALFASTVSKSEVVNLFSSGFLTDPWYMNFDANRLVIKGAIVTGGATTNLSYIQAADNVPCFIFHGTHDLAAPFYSGRQGCIDPTNPVLFGGAAIAQKLDGFPQQHSYYFVEGRGVGHTVGMCQALPFPAADPLRMLWFPDLVRFMKTSMLDGYPNQIHKVITPWNTSPYDYCTMAGSSCNGGADFFILQMLASNFTCYNFPAFSLTTTNWSGPAYLTCSYPPYFPAPDGLCGLYLKQSAGTDTFSSQNMPNPNHIIRDAEGAVSEIEASIALTPNPFHDQVAIHRSRVADADRVIEVLTLQGAVVHKTLFPTGADSHELNLQNLPAGIYFVRMQDADGHFSTQKLLKQ